MMNLVFQFSTSMERSSKWIRRLTHSPFSHVDLVLDNGDLLGSSDSPKSPVVQGNPRGVAVRPDNYMVFKRRARCVIQTMTAPAIRAFMIEQIGKPFDREAVRIRYFLSDRFDDRDWDTDDAWFCSELVAKACERGGLFPYKLVGIKNRITPSDLLLILNPFMDVDLFWKTMKE
jgi:hypothetical protein